MRIRLNDRFYIDVDPHNKLKYELFEEINDRALRHGAWGNLDKCVENCVDRIISSTHKEITLHEYFEIGKAITKELLQGVIEYDS